MLKFHHKSSILFCFLLCVLLCSCKEYNQNEQNRLPSSSMQIAVEEGLADYVELALKKFTNLNPNTDLTLEIIPHTDNQDTPKNKQNKLLVKDILHDIQNQKGPDLFILKDGTLFTDPVLACSSGLFEDTSSLLDKICQQDCFHQEIMDSGVINGKRYVIPLGYSLLGIAANQEWMSGWQPAESSSWEYLNSFLTYDAQNGISEENQYILQRNMSLFISDSIIDYQQKKIAHPETFCKFFQWSRSLNNSSTSNNAFTLCSLGNSWGLEAEIELINREKDSWHPCFYALPNNTNGVTAQINTYAAIASGSHYTQEAADFIEILLSDSMQGLPAWQLQKKASNKLKYSLSVNQELQSEVWSDIGLSNSVINQLEQELEKINSAKFTEFETQLISPIMSNCKNISVDFALHQLESDITQHLENPYSD